MTSSLGTHISHFRVGDLIAKGGMGEVYVGYDEKLDRRVALKSLRSDRRPDAATKVRFLREARVLSQLAHPNICQIFDYIEGDETDVLVLELIEGQSLTEAMKRGLDYRQKLHIAEQIAGVLMAAHEKGIIHRDLKPDNIMLTPGDQVKVLDFGLSRFHRDEMTTMLAAAHAGEPPDIQPPIPDVEESQPADGTTLRSASNSPIDSSGNLTDIGKIMGTLGYMSPEQARGEMVSTASDLYSFGLLLQELFTGKPPYEKELYPVPLLVKATKGETLRIEGVDADIASLIGRLKSFAPAARPSARDTAERLAWIRQKPHRRNKKILITAVMVVLALFGGVMTLQTIRATRAEKAARQEAETSKQVSEFLVGLFKVLDPSEARGSTVTARELLDLGALKIEKELKDHPKIQTRLMGTIGVVYYKLGLYSQAQPLLENALAIQERTLGPDHLDVAESLNNLANLYALQGKYAEAEPLIQRCLKIREKTLGPDHPDVATTLYSLTNLYALQGKYAKAEPLSQRSLKIREDALGPDHPDVAESLINLANLYARQGKYAEAEPLSLRSLKILEKALDPDHPDVAGSLNNLANLYVHQARYAEAEPLYRRSLKIREKALGPDHPEVAKSLYNLALVNSEQGKYGEAELLYQRSLKIMEKTLGPDHPNVANVLNNLAVVYQNQGRLAEAEPLFERNFKIAEKLLDPDDPRIAKNLYSLAGINARLGRRPEALAFLRQALRGRGDLSWMRSIGMDPDLVSLHGDPEFERIVVEVDKRAEENLTNQKAGM